MDWNLAGNRVRYRFQVKIISCQTRIVLYGRLSENILFNLQTNTLATLGSILDSKLLFKVSLTELGSKDH